MLPVRRSHAYAVDMPNSSNETPGHPFSKDELAQAIGGTWSVHPGTWRMNWSDAARRIHGWRASANPTIWQALEFIEPHDRTDLFAKALRCVELGHAFESEVDLRTASGELKRVAIVGFASGEDGLAGLQGT